MNDTGLSLDTLRYYERIGLIPPVTRKRKWIRDYGELDIRRVEFVKCMRSAGLPIEVLIDYMELVQQGDQTMEARKDILEEQRALLVTRIAEMQKTLEIWNHKIEVYENAVLTKEQEIVQTGTRIKASEGRNRSIKTQKPAHLETAGWKFRPLGWAACA